MRAALRSTYGLDLREVVEHRTMPAADLADLVTYLPPGSVFWMDVGGPAAISGEAREIRAVVFWLRNLSYQMANGKGEKPQPPAEPLWAHERRAESDRMNRKAAAFMRRRGQTSARA